jgi:tripartite-type tricarboxylate transporter receptor subunit TctC
MALRFKAMLSLAVVAVVGVDAAPAAAQAYPTKPIRWIAPFPAGGPVDAVARLLAPRLSDAFKQSVVVDNRPGGSGMIGIETGVRATPDGYTMLIVSSSYGASAALHQLPYHPVNDVTPISLLGVSPHLAVVHASVPVASVKELIAYDKANPGKLNYGSSGTGGSVHLATELFNQMAGTRMTHVPYKGQAPAMNDLLGGQIQFFMASPLILIPHVKANRLRALGVTGARRIAALPEVPAIGEIVTGFESAAWQAVVGPSALPKNIAARWNGELDRILKIAEVHARLSSDGMEIIGGPAERFLEVLKRDVAKWQRVVKTGDIKASG